MSADRPCEDTFLLLKGLPTLERFKASVREYGDAEDELSPLQIEEEWRGASIYFAELQEAEADWADHKVLAPLSSAMNAALIALDERSQFHAGDWRMVEIDRLGVFQRFVNSTYAMELEASLPKCPTDEDIVRVALDQMPGASVRAVRLSSTAFTFFSASGDLRITEAALLDIGSVKGYTPQGRPVKMIGIFVGMSTNHIHAVKVGCRLLLMNGTHRTFALRSRGITHMPCFIVDVTGLEDQSARLSGVEKLDKKLFLSLPRPPLFKDYFEARLNKMVRAKRFKHMLNVVYDVRSTTTAEI